MEQVLAIRGNKENMKYIPRPLLSTIEEGLAYIKTIEDNILVNEAINWAVTEKNSDLCIGIMGFYRTQAAHFRTEIGYMLLPEFHGKGYATEAVKTLLHYAFETLNFHSIEAVIDARHEASERVLLKNGFEKEAHFKENFYYNNEFTDTKIFGLLRKNFKI